MSKVHDYRMQATAGDRPAAPDAERWPERRKTMRIPMMASLLLVGCAGARVQRQASVQDTAQGWETAARHDFEEHRVRLPPNTGVMGACAVAFRIDGRTAGMAIVDNDARGTLSVFIGWSGFPAEAVSSAPGDLRVAFVTLDGSEYMTRCDAGGGHGLLFRSPADVPKEKLAYMEIKYPRDARWLVE